jgi:hypothetical protein
MRHNLRAVIVERFGTQLRCAEQVGTHVTRLNRIIRGWIDPTPLERERLVSALSAEPQWLFSTTPIRIPRPTPFDVGAPQPAFVCASKNF